MTDNASGTAVGHPPAITRNIRAELARAGRTARMAQEAIGVPASTWDDRMREPGYWRINQLERLAAWLDVELADLFRNAR
jgi:hypothetical protein